MAAMPTLGHAAASAQGVALNVNASCSNANLDLTLTTSGATREAGQSTNAAGATLASFEGPTQLTSFSGTYLGYDIGVSPTQPAGTLIGAYAYVGETPPAASNTAEFFVLYNCSTRQVLEACYGPYGTCPQTAQQALAAGPEPRAVPTLGEWALALTMLLLSGAAAMSLRSRTPTRRRPTVD